MRFTWLYMLCCSALWAQPLQRGAVVLDVASEQVIRSETSWRTSWGSFSRDYLNKRLLVIRLRQLGPGNPMVTVRWYFIGRHVKSGMYIYDSGESTGSIAQGGIILKPYSAELVHTRERTILRGNQQDGAQPWGWSVFVTQGNVALWESASVPELVDWTRKRLQAGDKKPARRASSPVVFESVFGPR